MFRNVREINVNRGRKLYLNSGYKTDSPNKQLLR